MNYKQCLRSLVLACIMGMPFNSELYAVETHYYKAIINNSEKQVTVVISTPTKSDNSVTVETHVEGVGSLTYSYTPTSNSSTGYTLRVIEPPSNDPRPVQVDGIKANYAVNDYDYSDNLYYWPEDSPAVISPDGHSLQLPVFNIVLTGLQKLGDEPPCIFYGYHFSTLGADGVLTQITTDNLFRLIEIDSNNFRLIRPLTRPEPDKSNTESESTEGSLPDTSGLNLSEFKENREDKDDPEGSCSSGCFIHATH
ncbi:hypothetical protein [Endozoicomonas euniceicola]|uniref:Uncharacterized protein n=1 Tax=Endozoicomonas euniceicola TaxID=1234143 RepID=A0ABY6GYL9_9GAMM|nr:hypothetical protein [Endozoicomonas euniceicola]UYM17116.1 hypothetical protein NX720_04110 [Endozoicomonas euniceicola]